VTGQPHDDDPYAAELREILDRIPKKWGRWIDVQAGWYPLVVATNQRLAEIDPNYIVHQIKEKYGTLRYYCVPSLDDPAPEIMDAFDAITEDAERKSALICERCGEPDAFSQNSFQGKTPCGRCTTNGD